MTEEDRKAPGLRAIKSIEVGNIFKFGTKKYAEDMGGLFMDNDGQKKPLWFASYGIGITRMIGVLVELFNDDRGIIWPKAVAPYQVHLVSLKENEKAEEVYKKLQEAGVEVLYDDREDVGAGQKFADADLIGIPVRLVVSPKTEGKIEWKERSKSETELLNLDEVINKLKS
jgi:prolyl-tRNA synthetase